MKPKLILTGLAVLCVLYLSTRAVPNLWGLLIDSEYFIPRGSSVFTFRPTVMNPGSGDWWLYGEDSRYYFYFEDDVKLSKQAAETCQGFLKDDVTTWCKDE
jgi:hypothetical protein